MIANNRHFSPPARRRQASFNLIQAVLKIDFSGVYAYPDGP
jgi:hypothetical protein